MDTIIMSASKLISKKAIRCLGIAESFSKKFDRSILAGVVMRRDFLVDGIALTTIKLGGLDATQGVLEIYRGLKRNDINFILINGAVISLYNVIDLPYVHEETGKPLICITYNPSKGLEDLLIKLPEGTKRVEIYRKNGPRRKVYLSTGYPVYLRCFGLSITDAVKLLNSYTIYGRIPEPVKIANMIARAVLRGLYTDDEKHV